MFGRANDGIDFDNETCFKMIDKNAIKFMVGEERNPK
jgi:hypothetical protein